MSIAADDKVILTVEQAVAMLPDGKYVHNYVNPGTGMFIGCDYGRDHAIAALKKAIQIELGGENCMRMKHPIIAWDSKNHFSFFEADMEKVKAFEERVTR